MLLLLLLLLLVDKGEIPPERGCKTLPANEPLPAANTAHL